MSAWPTVFEVEAWPRERILAAINSARRAGRDEGLRAALEAATQAELEPDQDDLFYAPGERGLRAIERLLEETKERSDG